MLSVDEFAATSGHFASLPEQVASALRNNVPRSNSNSATSAWPIPDFKSEMCLNRFSERAVRRKL
jgi:hypothetical protein